MKERIPPGQHRVNKLQTLHVGAVPDFNKNTWNFKVFGLIDNPFMLNWEEFNKLPIIKIKSDFHCVTSWSKLDNEWEGVSLKEIIRIAEPKPEAKFLLIHCFNEYKTNLSLDDALQEGVMLANKCDGKYLSPEHGFPLRLVVPHLYAWKSAKWVRSIEFLDKEVLGYWEQRGYHKRGDPWKEERYS